MLPWGPVLMHYLLLQPSTRGTVNGISQSLVAIARSMGPLVGAMVFAWSESNGECDCSVFLGREEEGEGKGEREVGVRLLCYYKGEREGK